MSFWLEPTGLTLRVADGNKSEYPPYRAIGFLLVVDDVVILSGLHGKVRFGEVRKFYAKLAEMGHTWLIARRTGKHRLPFGEVIEDGPFGGWFKVDLRRFA